MRSPRSLHMHAGRCNACIGSGRGGRGREGGVKGARSQHGNEAREHGDRETDMLLRLILNAALVERDRDRVS